MRRPSFAAGVIIVLVMLAGALPAHAAPGVPLPAYLKLPPDATVPAERSPDLKHIGWGELALPKAAVPEMGGLKFGEIWHVRLRYNGDAKDPGERALFDRVKPSLLAAGWTVANDNDAHHPLSVTLRTQKDGKEAWLLVTIYGSTEIFYDMVEVKPQPLTLVLKPPAAQMEKITPAAGDFPFLAPLPGAKLHGGRPDGALKLPIRPAGDGPVETIIVGTGSITKDYDRPELTTIQFVSIMRPALEAAGWAILYQSQSPNQGDAVMSIHYGSNGRDIWGYLRATDDGYSVRIADAGQDDLAKSLAKDCHVALSGVVFDFEKASLRPESDSVLTRAAAVLKQRPPGKIEIQGHTDAVGSDAYNQPLSEARAATVMAWFTAHGIAADRLSAKGYGKTHPVASNDSDDGRARNRRVEIADLACVK